VRTGVETLSGAARMGVASVAGNEMGKEAADESKIERFPIE
jgi:hypothetical protein